MKQQVVTGSSDICGTCCMQGSQMERRQETLGALVRCGCVRMEICLLFRAFKQQHYLLLPLAFSSCLCICLQRPPIAKQI